MSTNETLEGILKDFGPDKFCKSIVDKGRAPCSEWELTAALSKHVGGDRAFAKLYEAEESVRRACNIAKAMPFVADFTPTVVTGTDTRDLSDESEAIAHLKELGARKWPTASEAQQFANAFSDPVNKDLAARAHRRPVPTTVYAMPR